MFPHILRMNFKFAAWKFLYIVGKCFIEKFSHGMNFLEERWTGMKVTVTGLKTLQTSQSQQLTHPIHKYLQIEIDTEDLKKN